MRPVFPYRWIADQCLFLLHRRRLCKSRTLRGGCRQSRFQNCCTISRRRITAPAYLADSSLRKVQVMKRIVSALVVTAVFCCKVEPAPAEPLPDRILAVHHGAAPSATAPADETPVVTQLPATSN